MLYVEPADREKSEQKKAYKNMKFIPVEALDEFLCGRIDVEIMR